MPQNFPQDYAIFASLYNYAVKYKIKYILTGSNSATEELLHEKYGWTKYENKHYENVFTRFFEGYYLPHKFGFDTRKNVASNEILVGTLTREEALKLLEQPPYDPEQMELDKEYVAKKMGISVEEFDEIINAPKKTPADYKNSMWMMKMGVAVSKALGMENRNLRV